MGIIFAHFKNENVFIILKLFQVVEWKRAWLLEPMYFSLLFQDMIEVQGQHKHMQDVLNVRI